MRMSKVIVEVVNGEVWLGPMADKDGSFKRMTEVTMGAFPTNPTHKVVWGGVDKVMGDTASVIMKGALTAVLERLSVVPSEVVRLPGAEGGSERRWWEVWK